MSNEITGTFFATAFIIGAVVVTIMFLGLFSSCLLEEDLLTKPKQFDSLDTVKQE